MCGALLAAKSMFKTPDVPKLPPAPAEPEEEKDPDKAARAERRRRAAAKAGQTQVTAPGGLLGPPATLTGLKQKLGQ